MIYKSEVKQQCFVFDKFSQGEDEESQYCPIVSYDSTCCSLAINSAKNYHTFEELKDFVDFKKKESDAKKYKVTDRGGHRNLLMVISQDEQELENNLKKLGFRYLTEMYRRNGYGKGTLKLYMLNWKRVED